MDNHYIRMWKNCVNDDRQVNQIALNMCWMPGTLKSGLPCEYKSLRMQQLVQLRSSFTSVAMLYKFPILNINQWMALFMVTLFTWIATELHSTFTSINDQLEYILENASNQIRKPRYTEAVAVDESIRHLSLMYVSLCDAASLLDFSFGIDLLLFLIVNFMHLLRLTYFIAMQIFVKWISLYDLLILVIFDTMYGMWHANAIEPCHRQLNEIDRTNLLVSRLANKYKDLPISVELKKFSQYLMLNRIAYAPMGLFTLSRSLIATMATNVTSYLVVVIQFESFSNTAT